MINKSDKIRINIIYGCMVILTILSFALILSSIVQPEVPTFEEAIENATNDGINIGAEAVIYTLTLKALNCEQMPITYQNISYTLFPIECLDLNQSEVK